MKSIAMKLMRMGLLVAVLGAVSLLAIPRLNQAFTPPVVQQPEAVLPPPGVKHLPKVEDLVFEMTNQARRAKGLPPCSYTHLRAHETDSYLVCRLLLEKKKT